MHYGEISDGGGDGDPAGPWGGGDGGGDEAETEVEEEVEVMEMKMIEKNAPAGETDGGRKGGGKTVPTLKASCTSTMAPFTVGTCARKTGAEKVREKRAGVWSFCGLFVLNKNGQKASKFHD